MNAKLSALLAITAAGWAAGQSLADRQADLEQQFEAALAQKGISIGGSFTGQYANSAFSGDALDDSVRSTEAYGFTSVDFDLRARPNTAATVRGVFRLHLDWPNFWSSPYTPFETRWVSLDGSAQKDQLRYSVGSIQERWSPLTMWAPEPSILFQPRIFEQQQNAAMAERFLGDNYRNLTGAHATFRAMAPEASVDSFALTMLLAKLGTGANAMDKPPKWMPYILEDFDRILWGPNLDVTALGAVHVGASHLRTADLVTTFYQTATQVDVGTSTSLDNYHKWLARRDSLAEKGQVTAFRGGFDVTRLAPMGPFSLSVDGEFAMSSWNVYSSTVLDTADRDTSVLARYDSVYTRTVKHDVTGNALIVEVNAGLDLGSVKLGLMGGYLMNDSAWRNDVAQSPVVYQGRVYNTDQDRSEFFRNYSLFDALYHYRHRFVPETDANGYVKNPVEKIAYTNYVTEPGPARDGMLLTEIWTRGDAIANRVGPKLSLTADVLDGSIELKGTAYLLQEESSTYLDSVSGARTKADFQRFQAGARLRLDPFLGGLWDLPIELSGSWEQNTASADNARDLTNTIFSAGLYAGLVKRLSLMAGWQQVTTDDIGFGYDYGATQSNLAVGLEYKVAEGAYLVGLYNVIGVDYDEGDGDDFTQDIIDANIRVTF